MRLSSLFALIGLALTALIVSYGGGGATEVAKTTRATSTGPTLTALPAVSLPPIELHSLAPASAPTPAASTPALAATTTAPKPIAAKTPTPAARPRPAATTTITTSAQVAIAPAGDIGLAASSIRNAVVNIICFAPPHGTIHSTTGSGVVVTPSGLVLTNAHIATSFLLADRGVSCRLRTGDPATDAYTAKLVYLPTSWITANANILSLAEPTGTGEGDYAILAITGSLSAKPLPSSFAYVPLAVNPPAPGTPIVIGSYPAQFLQSNQIISDLFATIVYGSVKDIFTLKVNSIDVISLGGSAAAQQGSSGGGVVDNAGNLLGTIVTSTSEGDTSARTLSAITTSYIRRAYLEETGQSLDTLLATDPATAAAAFAPQIPTLGSIVTAALTR